MGGHVRVPTLTGEVAVKVKRGTQPGEKVVLMGKGIRPVNSFAHGNQYVHFKVSIPVNLTEKQRSLIEEFGKEEQGENDEGDRAAEASG